MGDTASDKHLSSVLKQKIYQPYTDTNKNFRNLRETEN